jgi:3-deoxy-manno-octulosonate cytidylyltransferase (CMP-KDO synthetase)
VTVLAIIPARFASTRFPGKPLAPLSGRPMIQWVYERARAARRVDEVVVATDDARIAQAVRGFGGRAVMTADTHRSGTDRLAEVVAADAAARAADAIVNVQGDEPLLDPSSIDRAVEPLLADGGIEMATICVPITDADDLRDPNKVKVVADREGFALYFSRAPVPFWRDGRPADGAPLAMKHVGLYTYRPATLLELAALAPTPLEQAESLEQLRALESGIRIKVVAVERDSLGIDTPEDLRRAEALVARLEPGPAGRGGGR